MRSGLPFFLCFASACSAPAVGLDETHPGWAQRFLAVVDVSMSMAQSDPSDPRDGGLSARGRAVAAVALQLSTEREAKLGVVSFSTGPSDLTGGFRDLGRPEAQLQVYAAALALGWEQGNTNYQGALEMARELISDDYQGRDGEHRAVPYYTVVFMTDGGPSPISEDFNLPEKAIELARALHQLKIGQSPLDVTVHTVYLTDDTPREYQSATRRLLGKMAEEGGGTFRAVEEGHTIDLLELTEPRE